jgi:hypothetical protein
MDCDHVLAVSCVLAAAWLAGRDVRVVVLATTTSLVKSAARPAFVLARVCPVDGACVAACVRKRSLSLWRPLLAGGSFGHRAAARSATYPPRVMRISSRGRLLLNLVEPEAAGACSGRFVAGAGRPERRRDHGRCWLPLAESRRRDPPTSRTAGRDRRRVANPASGLAQVRGAGGCRPACLRGMYGGRTVPPEVRSEAVVRDWLVGGLG